MEGFHYDSLLLDYYRAFYRMGISVEFAAPEEDLSGYKLVLAPALLMVNGQQKENLENYAKNGGNLLISFRSGIKTMENTFLTETIPGDFGKLAGIEVHDFDPLLEKETKVSGVFGTGTAKLWCDIITPVTAKAVGNYIEDFYAGTPCMTVNSYGDGQVYYLGCDLDEKAMEQLMKYLCSKSDISTGLYSIEGVECVHATDGSNDALFIMNHNGHCVTVPVDGTYTEMLSGDVVEHTVFLEAYEVAVLKEK